LVPTAKNFSVDSSLQGTPRVLRDVSHGVAAAVPLIFGYIPMGCTFGVLAVQQRISLAMLILMSTTVIGSVQFVAVALLAAGETAVTVVLSTALVNARYFVMSSALIPYIRRLPRWFQVLFTLGLTDDLFALHCAHFATQNREPTVLKVLATNITIQITWVLSGVAGYLLGGVVSDIRPYGFDFALPGLFIATWVMQITDRKSMVVAVVCAALAIGLVHLDYFWRILIVTLAGATLGATWESWESWKKA
jgi:4-azaleucine resistance transporter AzlC